MKLATISELYKTYNPFPVKCDFEGYNFIPSPYDRKLEQFVILSIIFSFKIPILQ